MPWLPEPSTIRVARAEEGPPDGLLESALLHPTMTALDSNKPIVRTALALLVCFAPACSDTSTPAETGQEPAQGKGQDGDKTARPTVTALAPADPLAAEPSSHASGVTDASDPQELVSDMDVAGETEATVPLPAGGLEELEQQGKATQSPPEGIHAHAQKGLTELVAKELDNGEDVDATFMEGYTALHLSAQNGHAETVRLLLDRGADVNAQAGGGWTALHFAVQGDHDQVFRMLLEDPDVDIEATPKDGRTPLYLAASGGRLEMTAALLDHGANPNYKNLARGRTPLHGASIRDDAEIIEILIEHGADVHTFDKKGGSPLHDAANYGNVAVIESLIAHGVDVNIRDRKKWTPLHYAAYMGEIEAAMLLVKLGADIEAKEKRDGTPVHMGAQQGMGHIVRFLAQKGADIEARTKSGQTPLHLAASRGRPPMIRELYSLGADLEATQSEGLRAMHFACDRTELSGRTVETLARCGAQLDPVSNDNWTPLHIAAFRGNVDAAQQLLDWGARIDVKDTKDRLAQDVAFERQQGQVAGIIIQAGNARNAGKFTPRVPDLVQSDAPKSGE